MFALLHQRLRRIAAAGPEALPLGGLVGLEKESLRVSGAGKIARTPHPQGLGAALTHRYITTDYSEALLELITPPCADPPSALAFLRDAHIFTYQQLRDETLWTASMPCILDSAEDIPIAYYGESNAGRMKSVYRVGLGHRYGRMMQVIAGVHYNYSLPQRFWPIYRELEGSQEPLRQFSDRHYFALIRNLQRLGWLITYLFGASPAVCSSFLANRETHLQTLSGNTRYEPWATSLRMGDIGYTNRKEACAGIKANYDSLEDYLHSLRHAITTPCHVWEEIGLRNPDGSYRQLNANLLQIENEYYSSVRPKQIQSQMEKPTQALDSRGVGYVELRSLDLDPFEPLGISATTMYFLEAFMILCLLADSPPISLRERKHIDRNLEDTAHQGRAPGFQLARASGPLTLSHWSDEIFAALEEVCQLLDSANSQPHYTNALKQVRQGSAADHTPSARILSDLKQQQRGFFDYTRSLAEQHRAYFLGLSLTPAQQAFFHQEAQQSILAQQQQEANDRLPFDDFIAAYLAS